MLTLVASLERYSKHPLARAILAAAKEAGIQLPEATAGSQQPGPGLGGPVSGHELPGTNPHKPAARAAWRWRARSVRLTSLRVPVRSPAFGQCGPYPYGYTPQNPVFPALYDVARGNKLEAGEERWMLETKAVRDRNRVSDALADAVWDLVAARLPDTGASTSGG